MNLSEKIFNNINWILVEKVLRALLTAITGLAIARFLGAEVVGMISITLTLYTIFGAVGSAGLDRVILRELGSDEVDNSRLFGGAFLLRLTSATVAFCFMNCFAWFYFHEDETLLLMCVILSFCFYLTVGHLFELYYRQKLQSKKITKIKSLSLLIAAAVKVGVIFFELPVYFFSISVMIETGLVTSLFIKLIFSDEQLKYNIKLSTIEAKRLFFVSWPLMLNVLAGTLYFHVDRLMLLEFASISELGRYALIIQLVSVFFFIFNAIDLSVIPVLNKLFSSSETLFWEKYQQVTALKLIIAVVINTGLLTLGDVLITLIAGKEFVYSKGELLIFSSYIFLVALRSLKSEYYVLREIIKPIFYVRVCTLFANALFNYFLIPKYGLAGAALSSVFCVLLNDFIIPICFRSMREVVIHNILALCQLSKKSVYISISEQFKKAIMKS